jgi:hypothetical protein
MNHIIKTWHRSGGGRLHLFLRDTGPRVVFAIGNADEGSHDYEEFLTYKERRELPEEDWHTQKRHLLEHKMPKLAREIDQGLELWQTLTRKEGAAPASQEEIAATLKLATKNPAEHSTVDGHVLLSIGPTSLFSRRSPAILCCMFGHMCITPFPLLQVTRFLLGEIKGAPADV